MKIPNSESAPQRTATRAPIDKPIRLQFDDAIEVLEGRCRNISIGGVFVELVGPQAHGSLVRFELVIDDEHSIRGLGEVVWARSGDRIRGKAAGIGIKFRFLEQRDRQRIFKLVSQHIKDRLANRPSMTASPEAPEPAVRPGMVFQPPESGAQPSASDLAPPASALPVRGPSSPKPRRPATGVELSPPVGATVELDASVLSGLPGRLPPSPPSPAPASPAVSSAPASPIRAPSEPPDARPARPSPAPEALGPKDLFSRASAPTEVLDLPVAAPSPAPRAAPKPPRAEEVAESVLEALPPLEPIEPEGLGGEIWAEPPPAGRRISAPPDDEPTLSSWNLEDASLDPPARGSVLAEADSVIGRDPALLAAELGQVSEASFHSAADEAPIPSPGLSFESTYGGEASEGETSEGEGSDVGAEPKRRQRPAWLWPALGIAALLALGLGFFWESRSSDDSGALPPDAVPTDEVSSADESEPSGAAVEPPAGTAPESGREPASAPRSSEAPPPPPPSPAPRQSTPRPATTPAASSGFSRLLGIDWEEAPGGLLLSFSLDGEITADRYRHFRLGGDPAREVIQLLGVKSRFARNQMAIGGPGVEQLRIGFHKKGRGDEIHVVLDMQSAQARVSDITIAGSQLLVRVSTDS